MAIRLTVRKLLIAVIVTLLAATAVSVTRGGAPAGPQHSLGALPARLAAVNPSAIYLAVSGYTGGESTSALHPRLSTAFSVNSGLLNAGSRTSPGKVLANSIVITKPIDSYTTQFSKSASTGHSLTSVTLYLDKAIDSSSTEQDVAKYVLSYAFVKSDSLHSDTTGVGVETVQLQFSSVHITYYAYGSNGAVSNTYSYCWNFSTNAAC
jgi:type VI protein secretion system component Hcp